MARAAAFVSDAQVTRIEEADKRRVFVVEDDGPIPGIRTADPELWVSRLRVRLFFGQAATRIAAMTVNASKHDRLGCMHGVSVRGAVAILTANALRVRFTDRLIDFVGRERTLARV